MKTNMKIGFIYIIENLINKKVYIGQTTTSVEQRWKEHLRHAKPTADQVISRVINKYGKDNFKIKILESCPIEQIDEREIYYISLYKSVENGYNISVGGKTYKPLRKSLNIKLIQDLYNQGLCLDKIAETFETTRYIIKDELVKSGNQIRTKAPKELFKLVEKEKILKSLTTNKSLRSAAKEIKIPYSTFRKACKFHEIEYNSSKSARHL